MKPVPSGKGLKGSVAWAGLCLGALVAGVTIWLAADLRRQVIISREQELSAFCAVVLESAERALQSVDLLERTTIEDLLQNDVTDPASLEAYASTQAVYQVLRDHAASLPQADGISIFDKAGKPLNMSRSWPPPAIDISDRQYFQDA